MDATRAPKAIVVMFSKWQRELLVSGTEALFVPLEKIIGSPYKSQIEAAHRFVSENYQPGDHVMLLAWLGEQGIGGSRYKAIVQLSNALAADIYPSASGSTFASGSIPIKCIYLSSHESEEDMTWGGIDRVLSDFPCTVENVLFQSYNDAFAVQRGSYRQIMRKEVWHAKVREWFMLSDCADWSDWLMLQTSHFVNYHRSDLLYSKYPSKLVRGIGQPQLLSTMLHSNCTKRRRGLPHSDAIRTGGQLTRISKATGLDYQRNTAEALVWSSQSFAEGGYDDVCNAPLIGPRRM